MKKDQECHSISALRTPPRMKPGSTGKRIPMFLGHLISRVSGVVIVLISLSWAGARQGLAQTGDSSSASSASSVSITSPQYVLRQGDVVQVKVYQEDDLNSISRIGRDGSITMPLLGSVMVVSNTIEQATIVVH